MQYSKIILVQVYIIFALPDYYSSEVIERHQNLFSGRQYNIGEKPSVILLLLFKEKSECT